MPQIVTFSKVMVMYFYAMKINKFGATCISDHLFKNTTFVLQPSFQPAKISFIEDWDGLKCAL